MCKGFCGLHGLSTKEINNDKSEGQRSCSFHVKFNSVSALTH